MIDQAGIQIKTRTSMSASECSMDSPGIKTPSVVARLMGLDLLPEANSPSNSKPQTKSHLNARSSRCFYDDDINVGARSLPETSRIEYHRLSLQLAKTTRCRQDENRSPGAGHYAKQIVKQVRESVSRRVVGLDITNTSRHETRRDQNLLLKPTTPTPTPSSSPKLSLRLDHKKNKSPRNSTSSHNINPSKPLPPPPTNKEHQIKKTGNRLSTQTCDQAIRSNKVEAFVRSPAAANKVNLTDKKSKKAPLSNELLRLSGPTILPVKKDPSPPATKLPQKQVFSHYFNFSCRYFLLHGLRFFGYFYFGIKVYACVSRKYNFEAPIQCIVN